MTPLVIDPGARPEGLHNERDAASSVQRMFEEIAPTYDKANHLLSHGAGSHVVDQGRGCL